ncbi:peptidoglycan-binding protein [Leptospira sp. WS39.C2]
MSTKPLLTNGSSGTWVKLLQESVNDILKTKLETDGKFGSQTETAVRTLQKRGNLLVDGKVGPNTWSYIDANVSLAQKIKNSALATFTNPTVTNPTPKPPTVPATVTITQPKPSTPNSSADKPSQVTIVPSQQKSDDGMIWLLGGGLLLAVAGSMGKKKGRK